MKRRTVCKLLSAAPVLVSDKLKSEPDTSARPWIGRQYWSNPLQDWQFRNGRMECVVSGGDRNVFLLTEDLSDKQEPFLIEVRLGHLDAQPSLTEGFVGFRIGIKGDSSDYRDVAIYGLGLNAGVLEDGSLFIAEPDKSAQRVPAFPSSIRLRLEARPTGSGYTVQLSAWDDRGQRVASLSRQGISGNLLSGGIALVCSAGPHDISQRPEDRQHTMSGWVMPRRNKREGNWRFWFSDLQISGSKVQTYPDRAFGPILWTMYTVSRNTLKLTAQMAPVGNRSERVGLQVSRHGNWTTIASSAIDDLSRTATFRVTDWDSSTDLPYRVTYAMDGEHQYGGTIRRNPIDKPKLTIGVLSCLNDYGFPHTDLQTSIGHFGCDLLAFEGDQIYERVASYGIQRLPLEPATLDYLRKWYLFGWSFRDLMRDVPSICMADDHDVFHGNVWGAGGKKADGVGQPGQDSGGYIEPAAWVNMVQRTQTSHLPDPHDPTPVLQNIGVYYTELHWGGVSFAILEDRKWKSAPKMMVPVAEIVNGWAKNPNYYAARDGNVAGAELLGRRQLEFLDQWAREWRGTWMKAVFSQTLFANVGTLPPPANTDAVCPTLPILKPGEYPPDDILTADHDSNSWPQSGRNASLRAFRRACAVHLCGDQHIGSTVQYGVDKWNDASYALCSPALSNLFPRRWFPAQPGKNSLPYSPRNTGEFIDGFGNKMTVHAVFNPMQMEAVPKPLMDRSPGYGIVELNRTSHEITFAVWPRRLDPRTTGAKPVDGWPVRFHPIDNGWSSGPYVLPQVTAEGRTGFCVQVIDELRNEVIYTLRVPGNSFVAPVHEEGTYTVRVFDPDSHYDKTHRSVRTQSRKG